MIAGRGWIAEREWVAGRGWIAENGEKGMDVGKTAAVNRA